MRKRTKKACLEDQATLLILLYKLRELGFQTQRLKLQKLVYLTDILGTILEKKPTTYSFIVYKHGPFSAEVFSDIEVLVSKGLVNAKEMECWNPNQERSFNYSITKSGRERAQYLLRIPEFELQGKAIGIALQAAGYMSGEKIQRLVYGEPNFLEAKRKGFGTEINQKYESALKFKGIAHSVSVEEQYSELNEDDVSFLFTLFMRENQSKP
jgi:hypothetical protein